jgi:hypothetical protein
MMRAMVNPASDCLDAWGYGVDQMSERKAMAKKRAPKRQAWNKGLEVGKRDGFTPDQVKRSGQQKPPVIRG